MRKRVFILFMTLCLLLGLALPGMAAQAAGEDGVLLAASNGQGQVRLLWLSPVEHWPEGGWRILDDQKKTLVPTVRSFDDAAMARLDAEGQESLLGLREAIAESKVAEEREQLNALTALVALSSFDKARAMGLAWVLDGLRTGGRTYRVVGLDKSGKPVGPTLVSPPVDSNKATPPPPAPLGLRAVDSLEGARLFWAPVPDNPRAPVTAYVVERAGDDGADKATVRGFSWDQDAPVYLDTLAPVEQELTYRVSSLDAFDRRSDPATVTFFMTDLAAITPPLEFVAEPADGLVKLAWKASENPNTAGYVVERSVNRDGLYEVLTPQGLTSDTDKFKDTTVVGGVAYHYRLRAVGLRGELGEPTAPVSTMPLNRKAPPAPRGLAVKVNPILVTLTWERADYPVAGYFIERRAKGNDKWSRLNGTVQAEREFRDRFNPDASGAYAYRVIAVSFDNRLSTPSSEVTAVVENSSPIPTPRIMILDGADGRVALAFAPGKPEDRTVSFLIRRGLENHKAGTVIAHDVPAKIHSFVDSEVVPGQGYWYSVEAVDAHGQFSAPTERRMVMVASPEIPTPGRPAAKLVNNPFPHVVISFRKTPEPFMVSLQRQDSQIASTWLTIASAVTGAERLVDANPVRQGVFRYRIVLRAPNGQEGQPSDPVEITR